MPSSSDRLPRSRILNVSLVEHTDQVMICVCSVDNCSCLHLPGCTVPWLLHRPSEKFQGTWLVLPGSSPDTPHAWITKHCTAWHQEPTQLAGPRICVWPDSSHIITHKIVKAAASEELLLMDTTGQFQTKEWKLGYKKANYLLLTAGWSWSRCGTTGTADKSWAMLQPREAWLSRQSVSFTPAGVLRH